MNKRARKLLLILAIIFFLIITPVIIAYALGYSIDWENKKPVLTGSFYFKSIPKKADIYINNKKINNITPAFIKRLTPKYYQVKIEKENYYAWEKNLKVDSKIVTEAKNILLIPINPEIKIIKNNNNLFNKNNNFLKFKLKKPNNILYLDQEQISLTPLPDNQEYNIFGINKERIALISQKLKELYIFDNLTKTFILINTNINSIEFSKNNNKLLYFTNNEIWIYDFEKKSQELITRSSQIINNAIWYTKTNQHIIFSTEDSVKIIELDNRDKRNIFNIFNKKTSKIIYNIDDEKIYLEAEDNFLSLDLE